MATGYLKFVSLTTLPLILLIFLSPNATATKGNVCRPDCNTQQVAVNERPRRRRLKCKGATKGRPEVAWQAAGGIRAVGQEYSTKVRCRRCQRKWLAITLCVRLPTDYKSLGCTFSGSAPWLHGPTDVCGRMHECVQYNEIHLLNVRLPGKWPIPLPELPPHVNP